MPTEIFFSIGDLINGAMQVLTDFINTIIEILPNPDPFPDMIEQIAWVNGDAWSFGYFWLDSAIDMSFAVQVILFWAGAMSLSCIFAFIWMLARSVP